MQLTDTDLVDGLQEFLRRYYHQEVAELAQAYPGGGTTLTIDHSDLFQYDPSLADDLIENPRRITKALNEALRRYDLPSPIEMDEATVVVENLPESVRFDVGGYRADSIGQYLAVQGQVAKTSDVRPRPEVAVFECQRCGHRIDIPQKGGEFQTPHECAGCERQGPFETDFAASEWVNHQKLRLQQPPEQTKGGNSSFVDVHLEGEAVGQVHPGDRATVAGLMSVEEPSNEKQLAFEPQIDGRAVTREETTYEDVEIEEHRDEIEAYASGEYGDPYELLVDSIAPRVQGMREIKEAVALQMFGGVRAEHPDGTFERGDPHILLLGDPGTAKSTILEDVENKAPRSTYASGKGASAAGMTAAAVRDDFGPQEWSLEAGALVLADEGIACVDEIDKVDEGAVESMHEALSKQKVHVNKGGINTKLPARTALLAAGNPKHGRFDPNQAIAEQIELGPTMLSRFDLLFMIEDTPDEEQDETIIKGMLDSRNAAAKYTADGVEPSDEELDTIQPAVDAEVHRAWIAMAKQEVTPRIPEPQKEELKESFKVLRMANGEGKQTPVPVTFRYLEGIQRLAEASARVRLSDTVSSEDIKRSSRLVGRSLRDVGMDPDTGKMDADVIETGTSMSQKDRLKEVYRTVVSLKDDNPDGVPVDEVVAKFETADVDADQLRYDVQKLVNQGDMYYPDGREAGKVLPA